jgi:hypothetical protein
MKKLVLIVSILMLAVCINAQRTFNDAGRTFFFISKGDAQSALGVNDAGLQDIARHIDWQYFSASAYDVTYGWWETENGVSVYHTENQTIYTGMSCNVDSQRRLNPQDKVTGFNLYFDICNRTGRYARPVVGNDSANDPKKQILSFRILREQGAFFANGNFVKEWYIDTAEYETPYNL